MEKYNCYNTKNEVVILKIDGVTYPLMPVGTKGSDFCTLTEEQRYHTATLEMENKGWVSIKTISQMDMKESVHKVVNDIAAVAKNTSLKEIEDLKKEMAILLNSIKGLVSKNLKELMVDIEGIKKEMKTISTAMKEASNEIVELQEKKLSKKNKLSAKTVDIFNK